ncbi:MAG: hypothetical protein FJW14_09490 [Acidimicrobiia bacterium]|nr:hypothetical protein [Acidimicrobiia bacterium]
MRVLAIVAFAIAVGATHAAPVNAQRGGAQGPPPTPRAQAPVDLTGDWVSLVTEDWRWRMMTPPKGDVSSIPVTAEARKVAEAWDPAKDVAAGDQCKSYSAPWIMRLPGRIRISWENDATLKVETEAGTQTRLFRFGNQPAAAGPATYLGNSVARWEAVGGRRGQGPRGGSLSVMTTGMKAGYLRKNGVPFSEKATVEEHYNATSEPNGDRWLILTTVVRDPVYLNAPWVTSTHFKKVPDGQSWTPTPCEAS